MITDRQEKILNIVVQDYINSAQPISSKHLEERHGLGICPATIRIEMQKLAEKGLISQPHTSAGRVPTDKGYRFFVDNLLMKNFIDESFDFEIEELTEAREEEIINSINFLRAVTKNLALISSNLVLGYLFDQRILWKEGWEKVIQEPEFTGKKNISNFFELIDLFEKEIESLEIDSETDLPIKIYIGKENPFAKTKEFSIMFSSCRFSDKEDGILAILGPKRMNYNKNIGLIKNIKARL